ncbi:MAG: macro domain protein, partial [Clostridia bacterium]|nr:macro domain protein [Clostridia bacterium]
MRRAATQKERLDYLVEAFLRDAGGYKDLRIPNDTDGEWRILRSLMNIRMPKAMDEEVLSAQDAYLTERNR